MKNKEYNNLNYGGGFTEEDIKRVSLFEQAANNWIKSTSEFLSVKNGFKAGAKWEQQRMYSDIEQKWLEYRSITNNEDAWCFKEWLVEQFKKK
jgi:hypothetical protein